MPWTELHIKTTADYAPQLSDQLALLGAQAVTFQDAGDQPIYEPTPGDLHLWQETIVIGLFDCELPLNAILHYLEEQQATGLIKNFHRIAVADQDWERVCLDLFKPIQVGKRLWVCPSWHTPPNPKAVNMILDPGLAFGTGTHPTTRLCLEWLDKNIRNEKLVIDYGCGSGILGIAALKLGAEQVIAIDNDAQAIEATLKNAAQNEIALKLATEFLASPAQKGAEGHLADVLIANILAQPLIELAPYFAELTRFQGKILLSGILISQIEAIKAAYNPWFDLNEATCQNEWACLAGIRK
jgi:ribosomal protein L11 methyltransferase